MVRSAAKNFEDVAIVTRVADYPALIEELKADNGALSRETRWRLAKQAFATTAAYDTAIANTLDQIAEAPGAAISRPQPDANAFPSTLAHQLPAGAGAALWRKSASAGGALRGRFGPGDCRRDATAGQGTELQQPGRSGRLLGAGAGIAR